jgi:hypothetical protein
VFHSFGLLILLLVGVGAAEKEALRRGLRPQSLFIHAPNKEKGTKALTMVKAKGNIPCKGILPFFSLLTF